MKCTVEHRIKMSKSPIFRNIWCNTLGLIFRQMWVFCVSGPGHPAAAATTGVKWKLQMQNSKIHYYNVRRWGKCWLPIHGQKHKTLAIWRSDYRTAGNKRQQARHWRGEAGPLEMDTPPPPLALAILFYSPGIVAPCHINSICWTPGRKAARIAYVPPSAGAH